MNENHANVTVTAHAMTGEWLTEVLQNNLFTACLYNDLDGGWKLTIQIPQVGIALHCLLTDMLNTIEFDPPEEDNVYDDLIQILEETVRRVKLRGQT